MSRLWTTCCCFGCLAGTWGSSQTGVNACGNVTVIIISINDGSNYQSNVLAIWRRCYLLKRCSLSGACLVLSTNRRASNLQASLAIFWNHVMPGVASSSPGWPGWPTPGDHPGAHNTPEQAEFSQVLTLRAHVIVLTREPHECCPHSEAADSRPSPGSPAHGSLP